MGVTQWIFQRFCNLIFVVFGLWLLLFLTGNIDAQKIQSLIAGDAKVILLIVLGLACLNSILAGWQIAGDYAKKISVPAPLITGIVTIISIGYLFYGIKFL